MDANSNFYVNSLHKVLLNVCFDVNPAQIDIQNEYSHKVHIITSFQLQFEKKCGSIMIL